MARAAHRPSQRTAVLEAALELLREGAPLSLDSAARAAGLSKPGLMYHFPTKESLMVAMVDHVIDRYVDELRQLASDDTIHVARVRLNAYVRWALTYQHDSADLVMLSDPRLRTQMTGRWVERFSGWLAVPDDLPASERARLHSARLLADGCWFADATGFLPIPDADRDAVLACALALLDGVDA